MIVPIPLHDARDAVDAAPRVRQHLASGGVIAYPTETSYGLGALLAPASLDMLHQLKPRPDDQPYLILVDGLAMADALGLTISAAARQVAEHLWPGPITLVLTDAEGRLPAPLCNPGGGVAVRETSHAGAHALVHALATPITSTSANRPGAAPARTAREIKTTFAESVHSGDLLILDGGELAAVPPSTVLDCTADPPDVIREGAVTRAQLRVLLGEVSP